MKKIFTILFFLFTLLIAKGQDNNLNFQKKYVQKINILSPGISGEYLLIQKNAITINYNIGVRYKAVYWPGSEYSDHYADDYRLYYLFFMASIEARNYMNWEHRISKNKRINKFTGAYGSFIIEGGGGIYIKDKYGDTPYYIEFGPQIGFQKNFWKIIYWDVNAGIGPLFCKDYFGFTFFSNIKFGIAL
jgi:hypothetical protein